MKKGILIAIIAVATITGAVVIAKFPKSNAPAAANPPETNAPSDAVSDAFANASSTFGSATTSTAPAAPKRWDTTLIASRHVAFTPPNGYWVYFSPSDLNYWLVKGTPPPAGSPDPAESAREKRVAVIHAVTWSHDSFPTYDRFITTMAQFDCAEGPTNEELVACLDTHRNAEKGKTASGLPYERFSLDAVKAADQSKQGLRTFVAVRLGAENDHAILTTLSVRDAASANAAFALAKTMRIESQ